MKTIYDKLAGVAIIATLAGTMASCVSEAPFENDGEVLVKMNVMMNSTLTRADEDMDEKLIELYQNCVVTVKNGSGILYQWQGVQNIPGELYMHYGTYTAVAWSGDSVPASLESEGKKFYKGREEFTVDGSSVNKQVTIHCSIANVVTSVNDSTINNDYIDDVNVTFSHKHGSASLGENWADKCYFVMPNDDQDIKYVITGTSGNKPFTKEGVIENVQPAHEYRLNFEYDPNESTDGGAFIQIVVEDKPVQVKNMTMELIGKPEFMWADAEMVLGEQIVNVDNSFSNQTLTIAAYNGFSSVKIYPDSGSESMFDGYLPSENNHTLDLAKIWKNSNGELNDLDNIYGINVRYVETKESFDANTTSTLCKYIITFKSDWLNKLPKSDKEYKLNVEAVDVNSYTNANGVTSTKSNSTVIRIANTEEAIVYPDPIVIDFEGFAANLLNVRSTYATIPVTVSDEKAENLAVQYRKVGDSEWKSVVPTRAFSKDVVLSGLTPGTTYEIRGVAGAKNGEDYEFVTEQTGTFTTDSRYTIPNASMEDWTKNSKGAYIPQLESGDNPTYWDSGNHGSMTMGVNLTMGVQESGETDDMKMIHTGSDAARLRSQFVGIGIIGKFAAGNLFFGQYGKTNGTDATINFGREYDGSHPSSLKVWANYRPSSNIKGDGYTVGGTNVIANGDHGQVYIAFTNKIITVDSSDKSTLFNPEADYVFGYGQVTWTGNFGPDDGLAEVNIPIEWKERAKTEKPTHMIIVCSASKYGDYFTGGEGSVLYLDDFELVYE